MKLGAVIILIVLFSACQIKKDQKPVDILAEQTALMDADRSFSDLCVEKGMKHAFIEYIDSNGVLLRPDRTPIIGAKAIDYLIQLNDTGFKLNWEPQHAVVSKSADIGYTYGLYAIHPSTEDTVIYGNYVSIWKKQLNGKWKFVVQSANEGAEEE